jgi:hypothetical protein
MARQRRPARRGKNNIAKMSDDIKEAAISALRNAAKETLNDLAEASPNWGGDFRESWYAETGDGKRAKQNRGEDGKYNLFNIPTLKIQGRNAKGQFTSGIPANIGKLEILIGNSSPYAQEAMDLIPGVFAYPGFEPKGEVVARGKRRNEIRGDVSGRGNNRITAPLDWYTTYMEGGAFKAAVKRGARAGFIRPMN